MSKNDNQQKINLYATSIASPFASMIAKFLLHPIDTIKSKVQINRMKMKYILDFNTGQTLEIIHKTWKNQKIQGFFRGVTISVPGSAIAFGFYMSAYEKSKMVLKQQSYINRYPSIIHLISGFIAQLVSCSLWLPIDIIKQRMQVQSELNIYSYKGPIDAVKKINLSEGMIGLYRAFGATLLFFGPFSSIFFVSFEKLKQLIVHLSNYPTLIESIICSAGAGAIAGYLTTPLQLVKLRMQIQRADIAKTGGKLENSVFGYKNAFHGLYLIVINQGIYSLFKGSFLRVCFSVPMTTFSMSLTEYFKQYLISRKDKWYDYI